LKPLEEATTKAELVPLTPEEALDFLMENGFTKTQYMSIRLESKKRNCDIYPRYKQISGAKDKYRPKGLYITESVASVSLQNLLKHTSERVMRWFFKENFRSEYLAAKTGAERRG